MSTEVEEALQLAILEHPSIFGLRAAEINPLVLYIQHRMDFEVTEEEVATLWQECFERAKATLDAKFLAVLGSFAAIKADLTRIEADDEEAWKPALPDPAPVPRPSRPATRKPAPRSKAAPGRTPRNTSAERTAGVTPKQIKYYGYLCYQTGAVPDYDAFAQLSLNQASARIKALENEVRGGAAGG